MSLAMTIISLGLFDGAIRSSPDCPVTRVAESIVRNRLDGGTVSLTMLVAVFLSGLPEAIAGTSGMKNRGWKAKPILLLWIGIAVVCSLSAAVGYNLLDGADLGFAVSVAVAPMEVA